MTEHDHNETPDIPAVLERFRTRLSDAGLKSTKQRDIIVERFFTLNKHINVDELLEDVREHSPRIGYATVYRTLKLLVEHGFAEPRQFGDGQTRYDPLSSPHDEHDHIICVDCRRVFEFQDETIDARLGQIAKELGAFEITRRRLELYTNCLDEACPRREASADD